MRLTHQRGFSMIEVLVAIVISAVALLALAGVNAVSLRYTKMSQYRGTATQLANDMGERLRANKGNTADGALAATGFLAGNCVTRQPAIAHPPTLPLWILRSGDDWSATSCHRARFF